MKRQPLSFFHRLLFNFRERMFIARYEKRYLHQELARRFFSALWESQRAFCEVPISKGFYASELPVTLVLGEVESGKSALIEASHQVLPYSSQVNSDYQPMANRTMPWAYLTTERAFIELPQYFLVNESAKQIPYLEQLLLCWSALGTTHKIDQVIITVSMSTLLKNSQEHLQRREEFWVSVFLILARLPASVKIYLACTELDRLQGFAEFFSDLSVEERQHPFGFAIHAKGHLHDQIRQQVFMLGKRLQRRMWWRCQSEHILDRRLLIAEFPQQFVQFSEKLIEYTKPLQEAFKKTPFQLKGCFFVSMLQRGDALDLLFDAQNLFAFTSEQQTLPMLFQHREYFVRGFFQQLGAKGASASTRNFSASPAASNPMRVKKFILSAVLASVVVLAGLSSFWGWTWWHLHAALRAQPMIAYKLVASNYVDENLLTFVSYESVGLPQVLKQEIARSATLHAWVNQEAKNYLNARWQSEVQNFYQKNIEGKYPLVLNAKKEIAYADFNAFYAPHGVLDNFGAKYLRAPAVQRLFVEDYRLLTLYSELQQFHQMLGTRTSLQWSFTAYPNMLSPMIKTVTLVVAGSKMQIKKEGLIAGTFHWPDAQVSQDSGYVIETDNSLPQMVVFQGTWSWVRLFGAFHWEPSDGANSYILSSPDHVFSIKVTSDMPFPALFFLLPKLTIPETI